MDPDVASIPEPELVTCGAPDQGRASGSQFALAKVMAPDILGPASVLPCLVCTLTPPMWLTPLGANSAALTSAPTPQTSKLPQL